MISQSVHIFCISLCIPLYYTTRRSPSSKCRWWHNSCTTTLNYWNNENLEMIPNSMCFAYSIPISTVKSLRNKNQQNALVILMFSFNYSVFDMFRTSKCSSSGRLVHAHVHVHAVLWYFFHASIISSLVNGRMCFIKHNFGHHQEILQ